MKEIVRVCKIHGELTEDDVRLDISGKYKSYRCKKCRSATKKKCYLKNRKERVEYSVKWKKKNRDHVNARTREDRKKNPEKYRSYERMMRARDPEGHVEQTICTKRGITRKEYREMLEKQSNKCAICKESETRVMRGKTMRLTLDHCHKTNKVREFLCHTCNTALGKFKENTELLKEAILYIEKHL